MAYVRNKILAIKALRDLTDPAELKVNPVRIDSTVYFSIEGKKLTLKEAKDLVEGIMRMAVRQYLEDKDSFLRLTGDPYVD